MAELNAEKLQKYAEKGKAAKIIPHLHDKDPKNRATALKYLAQVKGDDSFNQIVLLLGDPELSVRIAAAEALGTQGDKKGREHLRHAVQQEKDEAFLQAARTAMGKLPSE